MAVPEHLRTQAGRETTFHQSHHLSKRASNAKKKTQTTVSWPHSSPTPEQLAKAGFYYKPTANNTDNVICFLCEKSLDGWEPSDNPAIEHARHSPDCGWAINVCIGERCDDTNREEEDPLSEWMIEARTATFMESWPHDHKRGWKCKTRKMVDAGWCFNPTPESEDYATCFYCGLSLDGWEPKDDPMQEHMRRSRDCYFFTLINGTAPTKNSLRGKKGRTSGTSKGSRPSTQSNATSVSEAPSMLSLGGDATMHSEDSIMTDATIGKSIGADGKGRKRGGPAKAAGRGVKRATRPKKNAAEEEPKGADERIPQALHLSSITLDSSVIPLGSSRNTRATRANARAMEESSIGPLAFSDEDTPPHKIARSKRHVKVKGTAQGKPQIRLSDDAGQLESELQAEASSSTASRPARGTKRTSDGLPKTSQCVSQEAPAPKPKRGRKAVKTRDAEEPEPEPEFEPEADSVIVVAPEEAFSPTDIVSSPLDQSTPRLVPVQQPLEASQYGPSHGRLPGAFPPDSTIQTADATPSPKQQQPQQDQQANGQPKPDTPSPTQSSDAENQPPTSRPAALTRLPLFPPTTPGRNVLLSPSKRTIIPGRLQSTHPWTATDLETIFIPSPDKQNIYPDGMAVFKSMQGVQGVGKGKTELLSSAERQMSVEEWIRRNAVRAEEMLRKECERVVGVFEREGGRAMRVLGGLEVCG